MESGRRVGIGAPDRGICRVCGREWPLRFADGYVKRHGGCPGGGQPPAKPSDEEVVELPE